MSVINQNFNSFANDCVPTSWFQILNRTYWLNLKLTLLEKIISLSLFFKVLFKEWAIFEKWYNWFVWYISKKLWIDLIVLKTSILWPVFKTYSDNNYAFGIWLRKWNKKYLTAIKKGYLTKEDIDEIALQKTSFNHNNVYYDNWFDEVYGWLRVECPYDILVYWIEKGVYGSVARTFIPNPEDPFTSKAAEYIKQIHFDRDSEIVINNPIDQTALNKASEINMKYKIWFTE